MKHPIFIEKYMYFLLNNIQSADICSSHNWRITNILNLTILANIDVINDHPTITFIVHGDFRYIETRSSRRRRIVWKSGNVTRKIAPIATGA